MLDLKPELCGCALEAERELYRASWRGEDNIPPSEREAEPLSPLGPCHSPTPATPPSGSLLTLWNKAPLQPNSETLALWDATLEVFGGVPLEAVWRPLQATLSDHQNQPPFPVDDPPTVSEETLTLGFVPAWSSFSTMSAPAKARWTAIGRMTHGSKTEPALRPGAVLLRSARPSMQLPLLDARICRISSLQQQLLRQQHQRLNWQASRSVT